MTQMFKKILMLNYEFPPLGGGAGNATYYLLKEFAKYQDLKVDLITSSVDKFRIEKFTPNITIHFLDIGKKGILHYQSNKDLLKYSFKAYRYCKKLINKSFRHPEKPHPIGKGGEGSHTFDLIHAFFGIPCGYIAMKLDLPYIVSLRGSDVPFYNRRFYWQDKVFFQSLSRRIWKKAQTVVANSEGLKSLALQTAPNQEIAIIYNGVDTKEFPPPTRHPEQSEGSPLNSSLRPGDLAQNDSIKIISTGRLIQRKGYQFLIEAVAGNNDVHVDLIGGGNMEKELRALAKDKKANVTFLGKQPHDKLTGYLQNADIFILPSLNEGMSNSVLEAMACGLPIITADTGGSKELIRDNGFVIQKVSSDTIKEAIIRYTDNPDLLRKHGEKSRKIAEKMSWEKVASKYNNLYFQNEL